MTETNTKKIFILFLTLFIFSVGFKLILCSKIAVKNCELEEEFIKKAEIEKQIVSLGFVSSNMSSIEYLESKAKSLGFIEMTEHLLSLDVDSSDQVASLTVR